MEPEGGRAMEKLANSGFLYGVIDVTTTEVLRSWRRTQRRRGSAQRDCTNARALCRLGGRARHGKLLGHRHVAGAVCGTQSPSPQPAGDVNAHDGRGKPPDRLLDAEKLNRWDGPVRFSALRAPGPPFHDPIADATVFEAIEQTLRRTLDRRFDDPETV